MPARQIDAARCTARHSLAASPSPSAHITQQDRKENWIGGNWRYSHC